LGTPRDFDNGNPVIQAQVEGEAIPPLPHITDSQRLGYDAVHLPEHYSRFPIEPIHFITENQFPFIEGSIIKYVARWRYKNGVEDLKKAKRFLEMLIAREEGNKDWST